MMAALKEQQRYRLSICPSARGRVSVLHVRLTESALRSVEEIRNSRDPCAQPSIRFAGNQGRICIPRRDHPTGVQTFMFYLSSVSRDNPQGTYQCIRQYVSCDGRVRLEDVVGIQHKITVCATEDSYQKVRQSMTLAEEETRNRGTIVIEPGSKNLEKQVRIWKPPAGQRSVGMRPLRERVTHLLALKSYRMPELVLRLQQDGLSTLDRHALNGLLHKVATLNRDNTFALKGTLFGELRRDWPGYTEQDRHLFQRILLRKSGHSQNAPPAPSNQPPGPPKKQTDSSHFQKRPNEFLNPLVSKKSRKSHLASIAEGPIDSKLGVSHQREGGGVQTVNGVAVSHLPAQPVKRSLHPLSDVSNDSAQSRNDPQRLDASVTSERLWHRPSSSAQQSASGRGSAPPLLTGRKYTAVRSQEQRQKYKNDFDVEYGEYRRLHAHIAGVTRRFTELDSQLRRLQPGTTKYKMIHNQILQDYRRIKEMNPTYSQEKSRCEFLHRKLAHIKKLIAEFDQRWLQGSS
ncbi:RNA polymerase II elongation factor ELL-like [Arapaima gigas]